jgi:hypothetical protein
MCFDTLFARLGRTRFLGHYLSLKLLVLSIDDVCIPQGMSGTVEIKNPTVWEGLMKWSSRLRSEFYASTISQMIQLQRRAEI